jgi:hypothetical protein
MLSNSWTFISKHSGRPKTIHFINKGYWAKEYPSTTLAASTLIKFLVEMLKFSKYYFQRTSKIENLLKY